MKVGTKSTEIWLSSINQLRCSNEVYLKKKYFSTKIKFLFENLKLKIIVSLHFNKN
jgi:hypothetical protein